MKQDLKLLVLYGIIVIMPSVWFLSSSGDLLTFLLGVNLGVGLFGVSLSAIKLLKPDKYRFIYESDEYEKS